jgi:hypothetical protein
MMSVALIVHYWPSRGIHSNPWNESPTLCNGYLIALMASPALQLRPRVHIADVAK